MRLVIQGQSAVAIFFVLLGFVNSLKTIQLARCGAFTDALTTLSSSSFRRAGRLVIPSMAVTMIAWALCQVGAFQAAHRGHIDWLRRTSPEPSASWLAAGQDLVRGLTSTWLSDSNSYDPDLWTVKHLFKGTLLVYTTLLVTISVTPRSRLFVEIMLYISSWHDGHALIRMNVFAGMILAELSVMTSRPSSRQRPFLACVLGISGLYLLSYPRQNAYYAPWSRHLKHLGAVLFPQFAKDYRYWQGLGAQMLCAAILLSPSARRALSNRTLVWLGQISFPVYLLHGTLIRTVLAWVILRGSSPSHRPVVASPFAAPTPRLGWLATIIVVSGFWVLLLSISNMWARRIEPCFDHLTAIIQQFARNWGGKPSSYSSGANPPSEALTSDDGLNSLVGRSNALRISHATARGRHLRDQLRGVYFSNLGAAAPVLDV
ncbi:hypothetical protein V501_01329 [Pseudogymnoascus sp. VKM F-4519 (FW-2642)]|nr:hypothetical protein V501_01329 [Pseudogymnoascus sp. VKM F-4519 (FW-2642)]